MGPFVSSYIFEEELAAYGLPSVSQQCDILNMVSLASTIVDIECGRIDGDGSGSFAYSTVIERVLLPTRNRNLVRVSRKPIVAVSQAVVDELAASGAAAPASGNYFYTGVVPNTANAFSGGLSGIVAASGRYGYSRQDLAVGYPDMFQMLSPLNLAQLFGGPVPWTTMDVSLIEYDPRTGELWLPVGIQLQKYTEIVITYNTGYDPRAIPRPIKLVTAALVKNALPRGGVTALMSMSVQGAANATFTQRLLDPTLEAILTPYKTVRAI